jgi:hypothetical protein
MPLQLLHPYRTARSSTRVVCAMFWAARYCFPSIESMCSVPRMRVPYTVGPSRTVSNLEALTFCDNWRLTVRFPRKILNYLIVKRYTAV